MRPLALLLLLTLAGCVEMPPGAREVGGWELHALEAGVAGWSATGHTPPSPRCRDQVLHAPVAYLDRDTFPQYCPAESCGAWGCAPIGGCTSHTWDGRVFFVFRSEDSDYTHAGYFVHEALHAMGRCEGDSDEGHRRESVWYGPGSALGVGLSVLRGPEE